VTTTAVEETEIARQGGAAGRATVPWTARDVWLGAAIAALLVGTVWGLTYASAVHALQARTWVALAPVACELLSLAPVWWFAVHKRRASAKSLGFAAFPPRILAIGAGVLLVFYLIDLLFALVFRLAGWEVTLGSPEGRLSIPWITIVALVVIAPVAEEIFFRGFVFAGLRARYDWKWAAVISAAGFAAVHLSLAFFVPAFIMGIALAYLYAKSGSILPGMIVHVVMNAAAVAAVYLPPR
jgi:uncharacterized protein